MTIHVSLVLVEKDVPLQKGNKVKNDSITGTDSLNRRKFFSCTAFAIAAVILFAGNACDAQVVTFGVDVVEGGVTYETPGGAVLLTASDLDEYETRNTIQPGTVGGFPSDLAQYIINGQPSVGSPAVAGLSTYAITELPAISGEVSDFAFLTTTPPDAFLNHNGSLIITTADADIFAYIQNDLEGLLPNASVTSLTTDYVDNEDYFLEGTDSANGEVAEGIVAVNYITEDIVETVSSVPEPSNWLATLPCLGLLAFGSRKLLFRRKTRV